MATRYVWLGEGAALLNSKVSNRLPKGFSRTRNDECPFRKMVDFDAWKPVVTARIASMTPEFTEADFAPIPTKSQHLVEEVIKVRQWKDYFGQPQPEVSRVWYRRLLDLLDYVVYVTTEYDDLEPWVFYYRYKWVDD